MARDDRAAKLEEEIGRIRATIDSAGSGVKFIPPISPFVDRGEASINEALKLPNPHLSDMWFRLIEEAEDWEPASRASLALVVRALEAISHRRPPPDAHLSPEQRGELARNACAYLQHLGDPSRQLVAQVDQMSRVQSLESGSIARALRRRLATTASSLDQSLGDLVRRIGVAPERVNAVIAENAKAISAIGLTHWVWDRVQRLARALRSRRVFLETRATDGAGRAALNRTDALLASLDPYRRSNFSYLCEHLVLLGKVLRKCVVFVRETRQLEALRG